MSSVSAGVIVGSSIRTRGKGDESPWRGTARMAHLSSATMAAVVDLSPHSRDRV